LPKEKLWKVLISTNMNIVMHTSTELRAIPTGMHTSMCMAIPMQSPVIMSMDTRATMEPMSTSILDDYGYLLFVQPLWF
jgi:hypothetical protein